MYFISSLHRVVIKYSSINKGILFHSNSPRPFARRSSSHSCATKTRMKSSGRKTRTSTSIWNSVGPPHSSLLFLKLSTGERKQRKKRKEKKWNWGCRRLCAPLLQTSTTITHCQPQPLRASYVKLPAKERRWGGTLIFMFLLRPIKGHVSFGSSLNSVISFPTSWGKLNVAPETWPLI